MSTDVQAGGKADTKDADKQSRRRSKDAEKAHWRSTNFQNKKHNKQLRKRAHSFNSSNGKFFPPYMRKKDLIIPPTKFLLGGNITDPLNLNSLQDEEINRAMNAVTPKSSPLPTPRHRRGEIEVIIPPDITDPLNLIAGDDDATYEAMLTSPIKRVQKKPKKNKKRKSNNRSSTGPGPSKDDTIEGAKLDQSDVCSANESATSITEEKKEEGDAKVAEKEVTPAPPPQKRHKNEGQTNRASLRKMELKERKADLDKIVSPVIPQPGAWRDRHRFRPPPKLTPQINQTQATPNFKERDSRFQYGNYNRYYGYRNPNLGSDVRLKVLERHKNIFRGKDVLDIGCNTGHLTLAVARDFGPNKVVGIDIDRGLIEAARTNIRHYVNCGKKDKFFPVSMPIVYGPIDVPGVQQDKAFPHNISFVQGNYVLESDVLLAMEQPQFDVILCFSITKWLHLNWGDAGLKRAFKRMYAQLRPGGALVLEAQSWGSYKKKKKLTPEIWKNYHSVELFPHQFSQYLLSEVGFSKCEVIGAPMHQSKGFQRPIKVFIKEDTSFDTPVYSASTSTYGRDTPAAHHFPGNSGGYSFRLPDSVHFADEFSGDSGFPYGTPSDFNSPESGFSEGLHQPRRYPPRIAAPMEEVAMEPDLSQQDRLENSMFEEPSTSAELLVEDTAISVASSSAASVDEEKECEKTIVQDNTEEETAIIKEEIRDCMHVECDSEEIKAEAKTEEPEQDDGSVMQEINTEPEVSQSQECHNPIKVQSLTSELFVEDTTNSIVSSSATSVDEDEGDIIKEAVVQDKPKKQTGSVEQETEECMEVEYAAEEMTTNIKSEDDRASFGPEVNGDQVVNTELGTSQPACGELTKCDSDPVADSCRVAETEH